MNKEQIAEMEAQAAAFWAQVAAAEPKAKPARKSRRKIESDYCPVCKRTGCGGCR